ncbi:MULTISPECIES: hypothetical protein [Leptolyngbya]|uniref:hypothetical protein n=1 Tax=Leptolyngbya TaxID=47251 RepID=UPI00168999EA|nr:hypothetical protein [Leptolyngbya sp. FACHB-1624]MBD1858032.1 hypothetical protein [Leptolyngbya sp. FACHB-1624]
MNDDHAHVCRRQRDLSELSEVELDQISGGIDIFLSGSFFDQQVNFSQRGRRRRKNSQGSSSSLASAFQFAGSGFNSVEDVLAVLRGLANLFGRRS